MAPVSTLESAIYYCSLAANAVLLLKLYLGGLTAIYRWFSVYLLLQLARTLVLLPLNPNTTIYGYVWVPTEIATSILYYLVVYELYALVLKDYPGISRWGRRFMSAGMILCMLAAGFSLLLDSRNPGDPFPILRFVNLVRRGVALNLVLFIGLMTAYLAYYPVPLKTNIVRHAQLTAIYFFATTVGLFYRNLVGPAVARPLSIALGTLTAVTLLGWVFLLNPAGEQRRKTAAVKWSGQDEGRLLEQLRTLNDGLLAAARK